MDASFPPMRRGVAPTSRAVLFSGQGSQGRGMGRGLFACFPALTEQADRILGCSVEALCETDPDRRLGLIEFAQPAIYVVNALGYCRHVETAGVPDVVAGHSLGEFNALLAAGCFDFATGLRLVQHLARLMAEAPEGRMAAVLDATPEEVAERLSANDLDDIDIANVNAPGQIVLSGSRSSMTQAQRLFGRPPMRFIPLGTGAAFHSRWMRPAAAAFRSHLDTLSFGEPEIPVMAGNLGRPYPPRELPATLSGLVCGPVRWVDTVHWILARYEGTPEQSVDFTEIGPGDTLTRFIDRIRRSWRSGLAMSSIAEKHVRVRQRVRAWNQARPSGALVRCTALGGEAQRTRSEAMVLFGHRAGVYLQGYDGYFDLDDFDPGDAVAATATGSPSASTMENS